MAERSTLRNSGCNLHDPGKSVIAPSADGLRAILDDVKKRGGREAGYLESYYIRNKDNLAGMNPRDVDALADIYEEHGRQDLALSIRRHGELTSAEIRHAKEFLRKFVRDDSGLSPEAIEFLRSECLKTNGPWSIRGLVESVTEDENGLITVNHADGPSRYCPRNRFPWGLPAGIPADIMKVISCVADAAEKDPTGPSIMVQKRGPWPDEFADHDRVFVYDQWSRNPEYLKEVYFRTHDGNGIKVSIQGGSLYGYNPATEEEPQCYKTRRDIARLSGAMEEGLAKLKGIAPRTPAQIDVQFTGPYLARPTESRAPDQIRAAEETRAADPVSIIFSMLRCEIERIRKTVLGKTDRSHTGSRRAVLSTAGA